MNLDDYLNSPLPNLRYLRILFRNEKPTTIFDIGSCEGEDFIRYSKIFPGAIIYSVEPLPANLEKIKKNLIKYFIRNIIILPVALSDKSGWEILYVSSGQPEIREERSWDYGNKSSSLLSPYKIKDTHPWLRFDRQIKVMTSTLSETAIRLNIKKIDFIHLDVQGAELKVLKGGEEIIHTTKAIWLEVADSELYKNQPLKKDIELHMKSKGFFLAKDVKEGDASNQLYVNKRYMSRLGFFLRSILFRE